MKCGIFLKVPHYKIKLNMLICRLIDSVNCRLIGFYSILTFMVYLLPNSVCTYILNIYRL